MTLQGSEEVLLDGHQGIRPASHAFSRAIRHRWPTLWALCAQLAEDLHRSGERIDQDMKRLSKMRRLKILHGMAGTAVRRELGEHFACRFFMPHDDIIAVTMRDDSESPPSTRIRNFVECKLPFGFARLALLAKRAVESPDGFATDEPTTISDNEAFELLCIHAVEPYRSALETMFGVRLGYHDPYVSAACPHDVRFAAFDRFCSIETAMPRIPPSSPRV